MKKVLAFLVLLSHINFAMFIAQVDEVDIYTKDGQQVEDINSLFEYVDEVILGNKNPHPLDEDDDNARYFHASKFDDYCFSQLGTELKKSNTLSSIKTKYPPYIEKKLGLVFLDIQIPPPKG
jgi:hypothetical protein